MGGQFWIQRFHNTLASDLRAMRFRIPTSIPLSITYKHNPDFVIELLSCRMQFTTPFGRAYFAKLATLGGINLRLKKIVYWLDYARKAGRDRRRLITLPPAGRFSESGR